MKILADLHHFGLYNSLHLLFENRLNGVLYRPIGEDWLTKGYWRMAEIYFNHPATVAQYLGIRPDFETDGNGLYLIPDAGHNFNQKAITVDRFMAMPIDFVIASIPQHLESFAKLCQDHPDHPKLIFQVGNDWNVGNCDTAQISGVLASARVFIPSKFPSVIYHQEFDLKVFHPDFDVDPSKNIFSFVNCFNTASIYEKDWQHFLELEKFIPDWNWKSFGGSCRDGRADGIEQLADFMRESKFIWHVKWGGDGYGHVLHSAFAVGRPVIVKIGHYLGKLGGDLLVDGETAIFIDGLTNDQIKNKIEHFSKKENYFTMCKNVYNKFKAVVNFDNEAELIKGFLSGLK